VYACICCVRFSFVSTKLSDWRRRTSAKISGHKKSKFTRLACHTDMIMLSLPDSVIGLSIRCVCPFVWIDRVTTMTREQHEHNNNNNNTQISIPPLGRNFRG